MSSIETLIRRLDRRAYRHGVLLRPTTALEIAEKMLLMSIKPGKLEMSILRVWKALPAPNAAIAQSKSAWVKCLLKDQYTG